MDDENGSLSLSDDIQDHLCPWHCTRESQVTSAVKQFFFKIRDIMSQNLVTKLIIPAL